MEQDKGKKFDKHDHSRPARESRRQGHPAHLQPMVDNYVKAVDGAGSDPEHRFTAAAKAILTNLRNTPVQHLNEAIDHTEANLGDIVADVLNKS